MTPDLKAENPYLGLRYFDEDTARLFFGRDDYVADLIEKLEDTRFLAVLGHSGSGKSSLVRAGLIPVLRASGEGTWLVGKFRPEDDPFRELGHALDQTLGLTGSATRLRENPLGIGAALDDSPASASSDVRLLVVADQFEELFQLPNEESSAFIRLLLQATRHPAVHVVLTMRSDYLKDCAIFRDLPEQINRGMYLVPRLKRDELEAVIRGPARVCGVELEPPLVQRLLNHAAEPELDQLPLLEHLLARIWEKGASRGRLTIADHDAVGGWRGCLSQHANELFEKLSPAERTACEKVFRRLTFRDSANRDIRSRTSLKELVAWCGGSGTEAREVIRRFRMPDAALLTPVGTEELPDGTLIDITHESLIRNWDKLCHPEDGWIRKETEAREEFGEVGRRSRRRAGEGARLEGKELKQAEDRLKDTFTSTWVSRYFPDQPDETLRRVAKFVRHSRNTQWRNRALRWGSGLAVFVMLSLLAYPTLEIAVPRFVGRFTGSFANPRDGLRYIYVAPGSFEMGCKGTDCHPLEPAHAVDLTKGFFIGQTEVTQAAFEKVMKFNPSTFKKGGDYPVEGVSWYDANAYCVTIGMRLPTEAEWEYAARAGSTSERYGELVEVAWYEANSSKSTHPVASKKPNAWGLYDSLGNVWEWTNDWYDKDYYKNSPQSDPPGPANSTDGKVLRGGSWVDVPGVVRVSIRGGSDPADRGIYIGFRCAGELR